MKRSITISVIFGVIFALMFIAVSCGEDDEGPLSAQPPAADVTIQIIANNGSMSFSPNPTNVTVGQTVAWRNAHSQTHTATANGGAFDTGSIAPGATSAPESMTVAGAFPYHCDIHPSMVATLQVNP